MRYIYKIENLVDGKVYVGQTKNPKSRWERHMSGGKGRHKGCNTPLYDAMHEYGVHNFSFSIVEECEAENVDDREKHWINELNARNPDYGYNILGGGRSKGITTNPVVQYDLKGEKIATYNSFLEAARRTGGSEDRIKQICMGFFGLSGSSQWRLLGDEPPGAFQRKDVVPVFQYDKSGFLINKYRNVREASQASGLSYAAIYFCTNRKRKSAGGFQWRYEYDDDVGEYIDKRKIPVKQYSLSGEFIAEYESASLASRETGITGRTISHCCEGKVRSTGGYQWRFSHDDPPGKYVPYKPQREKK